MQTTKADCEFIIFNEYTENNNNIVTCRTAASKLSHGQKNTRVKTKKNSVLQNVGLGGYKFFCDQCTG